MLKTLRRVNELERYHLKALNGEFGAIEDFFFDNGAIEDEIGHVEDFIVEDHSWAVRYMEIDTRNWVPGKKVLVAPTWVTKVNWAERRVHVRTVLIALAAGMLIAASQMAGRMRRSTPEANQGFTLAPLKRYAITRRVQATCASPRGRDTHTRAP
ncbi:MAG: hypothetical protein ACREV3_14430 [Gammaproteobacteria bacterium]